MATLMPIALVPTRAKRFEPSLLHAVANAYANLKSLSAEILIVNESEDDAVFNRREKRAAAFFAAPDKVRIEQGGRRGNVTITDGSHVHHDFYFGLERQFVKNRVQRRDSIPGRFRPDFPYSGGINLLFDRIAERVVSAEILREEMLGSKGSEVVCDVLAVTYEQPSVPAGTVFRSPLLFWINSRTHLISRMEIATSHPLPAYDDTLTSKLTLSYTRVIINEPVSSEIFNI